jgi:hypothetical protein
MYDDEIIHVEKKHHSEQVFALLSTSFPLIFLLLEKLMQIPVYNNTDICRKINYLLSHIGVQTCI